MESPFYFYAAVFVVIWLGVSIGVLDRSSSPAPARLSNAPTKKPEAKAE